MPLWAEASDLLDGLESATTTESMSERVEVTVALSPDEQSRLRDRAEAQGVSLAEALRRLI
jgi:ribonuclease HI